MIYRIVDADGQEAFPAAIYHHLETAQHMAAQYNNPSFVHPDNTPPFRVQRAEPAWLEVHG